MRQATLSILGLYRYDPTLFDNFQIPEALDKELLVDNLLAECAELEVLYPDLDFLKFIIGRWSAKCLPVWNKLYETTVLKYDPIENYNRIEEWEETGTGSATETGTDTTADTGKETGTGTGSSSGTSNSDTTNAEQVQCLISRSIPTYSRTRQSRPTATPATTTHKPRPQ